MLNLGVIEALVTDGRVRRIAIITCLGVIVVGGILALDPSADQVNLCITVIGTLVTLAGGATALQKDENGVSLPGKVVTLVYDKQTPVVEQDSMDVEADETNGTN